jgi:hypothetical protein
VQSVEALIWGGDSVADRKANTVLVFRALWKYGEVAEMKGWRQTNDEGEVILIRRFKAG